MLTAKIHIYWHCQMCWCQKSNQAQVPYITAHTYLHYSGEKSIELQHRNLHIRNIFHLKIRADDKYSVDSFEVFHNHPLAVKTYLHCCVHYAPQCSIPLRPHIIYYYIHLVPLLQAPERDLLTCSEHFHHWRTLDLSAHLFPLLRIEIYWTAVRKFTTGAHYILVSTYFHYCGKRFIEPQCTKPALAHIIYQCAPISITAERNLLNCSI